MLDDTAILHSTASHERRRSPVMALIWVSVIVAHLTLAGLIYTTIAYSRESGYQNRALEDLTTKTNDLKSEMQLWQAYTISLQKEMIKSDIEVPEAPRPKLSNK